MSLLTKTLGGLKWSAMQNWGGQVTSLLVFIVLARLLEPAEFGLVALANIVVRFAGVLVDQGFSSAIIQRRDLEDAHLDTALWTGLSIGAVIAILINVFAELIAAMFDAPDLVPILRVISVVFCITSLGSVHLALLKRELNFKIPAICSLSATVIGGAVGVGCALNGFGVWSLVANQIVTSFAKVLLIWRYSGWRPNLQFSTKHFTDLFNFGINVVGIRVLSFLRSNTDKALIGFFLGPTILGYYTIAFRFFITTIRLISAAVTPVAFSAFSTMQDNNEKLRAAFYRVTRMTSVITFPAFAGLLVLGPQIVTVLVGEQWSQSARIVQVLALAGFLDSLFFYNNNMLLAKGKPTWGLYLNIINTAANFVFILIAVQWGVLAVAVAYALRIYLFAPIPLVMLRRLIGLSIGEYLQNLAVPLGAATLMVTCVYAIVNLSPHDVQLPSLVVVGVLTGGLIYAVSVYALAPKFVMEIKGLAMRTRRAS